MIPEVSHFICVDVYLDIDDVLVDVHGDVHIFHGDVHHDCYDG